MVRRVVYLVAAAPYVDAHQELQCGMNCVYPAIAQMWSDLLRDAGRRGPLDNKLLRFMLHMDSNSGTLRLLVGLRPPKITIANVHWVTEIVLHVMHDIARLMKAWYLYYQDRDPIRKQRRLEDFLSKLRATLVDYSDVTTDDDETGRYSLALIDLVLERVQPEMMPPMMQIALLACIRDTVHGDLEREMRSFALAAWRVSVKKSVRRDVSVRDNRQPTALQVLCTGRPLGVQAGLPIDQDADRRICVLEELARQSVLLDFVFFDRNAGNGDVDPAWRTNFTRQPESQNILPEDLPELMARELPEESAQESWAAPYGGVIVRRPNGEYWYM